MQPSPGTRLARILATIVLAVVIFWGLIVRLKADPAYVQAGHATAIDPQTLVIDGGRYRLFAITPPSSAISPVDAIAFLTLIAGNGAQVSCVPRSIAADGAVVAICVTPSGRDIGGALVGAGYAKSDAAIALYDNQQDRAHALGLGMWRR